MKSYLICVPPHTHGIKQSNIIHCSIILCNITLIQNRTFYGGMYCMFQITDHWFRMELMIQNDIVLQTIEKDYIQWMHIMQSKYLFLIISNPIYDTFLQVEIYFPYKIIPLLTHTTQRVKCNMEWKFNKAITLCFQCFAWSQ